MYLDGHIPLTEEELEEFQKVTDFTRKEISKLFRRFCYLDRYNNGYLTYKELNNIPEFEINPFNKLICQAFEKRVDYTYMTFRHFIDLIKIFYKKTDKEQRIKFLFDVFDLNRDQKLCRSVLKRICNVMGFDDKKNVEHLLRLYDKESKGYIDYNDFVQLYLDDESLDRNMLIEI